MKRFILAPGVRFSSVVFCLCFLWGGGTSWQEAWDGACSSFHGGQTKGAGVGFSLRGHAPGLTSSSQIPAVEFQSPFSSLATVESINGLITWCQSPQNPATSSAAWRTKPWTYEPPGDSSHPAITINQLSWWAVSTIYNYIGKPHCTLETKTIIIC